jgi:C4-dicarboxylate-specific signal transduction histidine kinase
MGPFETARFVLDTRLNAYRDGGAPLRGTCLTAEARLQLLVPVLVREHQDRERLTVDGILALESDDRDPLSDLDKALVGSLAAIIADYLAAHSYTRHSAAEVTRAELDMALAATAYRVCAPLQSAQSILDNLRDRVKCGEVPALNQLRTDLDGALKSLEDAVLATENLRLGALERRLRKEPTDLNALIRRVLDLQRANLDMAGVKVDSVFLAPNATVEIDPRYTEYVLECLIRGVWQEAMRNRQERSLAREAQRPNRLLVSLKVEPNEACTLRLVLHDNGAGWPDDLLQGRYHRRMERYFPDRLTDNRGLALWEAERLAYASGGRLAVRNHRAAGGILEFFFPLALTANARG